MLSRRKFVVGAVGVAAVPAVAQLTATSSINPRSFGARGDGIADDTAAVRASLNAAVANGLPLDGGSAQFAVDGDIALAALTRPWIRALRLRQLRPGDERKTLYLRDCQSIRIDSLEIDLGRSKRLGYMNASAGLWVDGGSDHRIAGVEVYGGGKNNGVAIWNTADSVYQGFHVHDLEYDDPTAEDDVLQGIWLARNRNCLLKSPQVRNLVGNASRFRNRYSRGITLSGNRGCTISDAQVSNVDQAIDITGSDGNVNCTVARGHLRGCNVGLKFANSAVDCNAHGVVAERSGFLGFIISGPSEANMPHKTERITLVDCIALDTGHGGFPSTSAGFMIQGAAFDTSFPRSCTFVRCRALDRQAIKTMDYGFYNNITKTAAEHPNRLVDCTSAGHRIADRLGLWEVQSASMSYYP